MELDSLPPLESESTILPPPEGFGPPTLPVGDGSPPLEAGSRPPQGDGPSLPEEVQYTLDFLVFSHCTAVLWRTFSEYLEHVNAITVHPVSLATSPRQSHRHVDAKTLY